MEGLVGWWVGWRGGGVGWLVGRLVGGWVGWRGGGVGGLKGLSELEGG